MAEVLNDSNFDEVISNGITLVDFYADWCGPCKAIAPKIEALSENVENANVVKVNVDESPETSAKYGIRSIPTFITFKDGEEINRTSGGGVSVSQLKEFIEEAR